jgi:hypothetical protein
LPAIFLSYFNTFYLTFADARPDMNLISHISHLISDQLSPAALLAPTAVVAARAIAAALAATVVTALATAIVATATVVAATAAITAIAATATISAVAITATKACLCAFRPAAFTA